MWREEDFWKEADCMVTGDSAGKGSSRFGALSKRSGSMGGGLPKTTLLSRTSTKPRFKRPLDLLDPGPPSRTSGHRNPTAIQLQMRKKSTETPRFDSFVSLPEAATSTVPANTLSEQLRNLGTVLTPRSSFDTKREESSSNSLRSKPGRPLRSISVGRSRTLGIDSQTPRMPAFLGRHPAPIPQRSLSLPVIHERQSGPLVQEPLYFGGPINRPRPGYTKMPRLVPSKIGIAGDGPSEFPFVSRRSVEQRQLTNLDEDEQLVMQMRDQTDLRSSIESTQSDRGTRGDSPVPDCNVVFTDVGSAIVKQGQTKKLRGIIKGWREKIKGRLALD